jgi:hypothetical protein
MIEAMKIRATRRLDHVSKSSTAIVPTTWPAIMTGTAMPRR